MKFRPLQDRVLVRRLEQEEKTRGGIIIPDTAKEKPMEGEVLAVGPGARDEAGKVQPLDVKPGDKILFGKWSGNEVKLGEDEVLIMREEDILGVVREVRARDLSRRFMQEMLAQGTTTAGLYTSAWPDSVEACFEAAEAVCGDGVNVRAGLKALIAAGLAEQTRAAQSAERYTLSGVISDRAADLLHESGEQDSLIEAHREHFTFLAEQADAHLMDGTRDVWLTRLDDDHANLRTVLDRALAAMVWVTGIAGMIISSVNGNNNGWCQDNEISWYAWEIGEEGRRLLEFTRRLLALRRGEPVFRREHFLAGEVSEPGLPDAWWFRTDGRRMTRRDWENPEHRWLGVFLNGELTNARDGITLAEFRRDFDLKASADYIDSVRGTDVELSRDGNTLVATATWSKTLPLVGNASILLDFQASASK